MGDLLWGSFFDVSDSLDSSIFWDHSLLACQWQISPHRDQYIRDIKLIGLKLHVKQIIKKAGEFFPLNLLIKMYFRRT